MVQLSDLIGLLPYHLPPLLGAWCAAGRLTQRDSRRYLLGPRLVLTVQLYFSVLISAGLLLGHFGWLRKGPALGSALLAGAVLVAWGRCSVGWWGVRSRRLLGSGDVSPVAGRSRKHWLVIARGVLVSIILCVGYHAFTRPDYEFDVLTYHLFFPARWVQDGAISIIPTWFGDPAPAYAPSSTEVYYTWLLLPMGHDLAGRAGQYPFWALLIASTYCLAAELGAGGLVQIAVCLALIAIPAITAQAATAMVDVALCAHFCGVALFALRLARTRQSSDAVGLILAVGLALGTKFLALPYMGALLPLIGFAVIKFNRDSRGEAAQPARRMTNAGVVRIPSVPILGAILLAAWSGGYWYVRNWAATGNPVYPLEVNAGQRSVFPGAFGHAQMDNSPFHLRGRTGGSILREAAWDMLHTRRTPLPSSSDRSSAATEWLRCYGPLASLTFCFAVALAMTLRRGRIGPILYCAGALAMPAIFWFVLPYQQPRFAWPALILLLAGAASLAKLHRRVQWMMLILIAAVWKVAFGSQIQAAMISLGKPDDALTDPRTHAIAEWPFLGPAWEWIDQNLQGVTIAYSGNNVPYFLLGREFENRVRYVPARLPPDARYHDFAATGRSTLATPPNTSTPAYDRFVMDPAIWLDNLRRTQVNYVLVSAMFPTALIDHRHDAEGFPIERQWLDQLSEPVEDLPALVECKVFGNGSARLYHLSKDHPDVFAVWQARVAHWPDIHQDETDAIDRVMKDATPAGQPIRDYPHAAAVIAEFGIKPVRH